MHRRNTLIRVDQSHTEKPKAHETEAKVNADRRFFLQNLAITSGIGIGLTILTILKHCTDQSSDAPKPATDAEIQKSMGKLLGEYKEVLTGEDLVALGKMASELNPIFDRNWSRMTLEQRELVVSLNDLAMKRLSYDSGSREMRKIVRYHQSFLSKLASAKKIDQDREALKGSLFDVVE